MHREETVQNEKTVKGKVLDEKGEPIPYAAVSIKGSHRQTITDTAGSFTLRYASDQPITLLASSVGFQTVETVVQDSPVAIRMYLIPAISGEVVVVGYINPKPAKQIPLLTQLRDTLFQRFSVYPNPVKGGREVTIQGRRLNKGKYTASLLNVSGQAVFTQEVSLFTKGEILKLAVPVAPPGVYTLCLMNGKGTSYTEKIKVE